MGQNILKLIKLADIITLINALMGFASIIMTMRGQIESALVLVLLAVIADALTVQWRDIPDSGFLGRILTHYPMLYPSGCASSYRICFSFKTWVPGRSFPRPFLVCGTLRLARFNISGKKDGFEGIPITAGGLMVALFLLVKDLVPYFEYSFAAFLFILSLLMVSTISYPKIKKSIIIAPMAIVIIFNIAAFFYGSLDLVKKGSLLLFILIMVYFLFPVWRKIYARNQ